MAVFVVVIGLGVFLFTQDAKNAHLQVSGDKGSLPLQGQEYPIVGRNHINIGDSHDPYNSNPPTSGSHLAQPADWGVYTESLPDEKLIHNLEHGGIWISYKDIDADTLSKLTAIAKANPGSVIMAPRPTDDSKIALASWGRLEKLDSYDEGKILDFIKANKNNSPEPEAK